MNVITKYFVLMMITLFTFGISESDRNVCILNDNYCDCENDEPLTSACSMLSNSYKFLCISTGFINQSISHSKVNDGICDCCDGSDESNDVLQKYHNELKLCPNTCQEMNDHYKNELDRLSYINKVGNEIKSQWIAKSVREYNDIKTTYNKYKSDLPNKENELKILQSKLKVETDKEIKHYNEIVKRVKENYVKHLSTALNKIIQDDNLKNLIALLIIVGDSEAVESSLLECDDLYVEEGEEPDDGIAFEIISKKYKFLKEVDISLHGEIILDNNLLQISDEVINSMVNALSLTRLDENGLWELYINNIPRAYKNSTTDYFNSFKYFDISEEIANYSYTNSPLLIDKSLHTLDEANKLRSEISNMQTIIENMKQFNKEKYQLLNLNYISENEFLYYFYNKCYSYHFDKYRYDICLFNEVKQNNIKLGKYSDMEIIHGYVNSDIVKKVEKKVRFIFNKGETCFSTKKPRQFILNLECSINEIEEIINISEPEVCSYEGILLTPMGCM